MMPLPIEAAGQQGKARHGDGDDLLDGWLGAEYERRHFRRWQFDLAAGVKFSGQQRDCLVRDISPGGAGMEFDDADGLGIGAKLVLEIEGTAPLVAEVRSNRQGRLGLAFLHDKSGERALARWLTLLEDSRRRHRRKECVHPVTLGVEGRRFDCATLNVSLGGAKIEGEQIAFLALGAEVAIEIDGIGPIPARVRHKLQNSAGLHFEHTPDSLRALIDWLGDIPETEAA